MKLKLNGLIAAPFTPMHPDRSVNFEMISKQALSLTANGVNGAFICGTTGEGFSLSTDERMRVAEVWVGSVAKTTHIVVHVGHNSMTDSQALAAHAQKIGASAFATIGPNFFRPSNIDQLVGYCAEVAAAAPNLPFYFYHMPAMTGINLPMIEFLKAANSRIPNLAGIKFTHENLMDYAECVAFEDGKFDVLFGRDEILVSALALGATGAVGSTYNYMTPVYKLVIDAFKRGDIEAARKHQLHSIAVIQVMIRHGGLSAGKAMMKMVGVDCGPCRLPLRTLTTNEFNALEADLQKVGFQSVASKRP
jgi:N-acetylneuraminate lyase